MMHIDYNDWALSSARIGWQGDRAAGCAISERKAVDYPPCSKEDEREESMKRVLGAALGALMLAGGSALATDYPTQTVTIIVPYAPGGIADIAARTVGEALSQKWGQEVIVDNRTGGAGFLAATAVARAAPDGHTLFVADMGVNVINPALFDEVPYDPAVDFRPITIISDTPLVLVANVDAPFDTTEEYVSYARTNPGTLTFASAGIGSCVGSSARVRMKEARTEARTLDPWTTSTARAEIERPSRSRLTAYRRSVDGSPGRRKYACRDNTGRSSGTV
jgi:hypothetical protein